MSLELIETLSQMGLQKMGACRMAFPASDVSCVCAYDDWWLSK